MTVAIPYRTNVMVPTIAEDMAVRTMTPLHQEDNCVMPATRAQHGDIVTIDLDLTPENGYVPHPLFDTQGIVTFVLGWGNYLPGLHSLVKGMAVGDAMEESIDAGWGQYNPNLVATVAKSKIKSVKDVNLLKVGSPIYLQGGIQVWVTKVTDHAIVVDGNPPLAGASFHCKLKVLAIDSSLSKRCMEFSPQTQTSPFEVATFALSCFWGGELAFLRTRGVVGTKVGYTQGRTRNPSYEEVCTGTTQHAEAILVVFDTRVVSFQSLLEVALERLATTSVPALMSGLFDEDDDDDTKSQYRHGVYYHNEDQGRVAQEHLQNERCEKFQMEIKPAVAFYDAEERHQQYLYKGGQSAKKGNKETIRCFG